MNDITTQRLGLLPEQDSRFSNALRPPLWEEYLRLGLIAGTGNSKRL